MLTELGARFAVAPVDVSESLAELQAAAGPAELVRALALKKACARVARGLEGCGVPRGERAVVVAADTLCAAPDGRVTARAGVTDLFLRPGDRPFRVVDALLTNFHLPRSSLLLLVAAFIGREPLLAAYRHAIAAGYRFYSYGDAMLIVPQAEASDAR